MLVAQWYRLVANHHQIVKETNLIREDVAITVQVNVIDPKNNLQNYIIQWLSI